MGYDHKTSCCALFAMLTLAGCTDRSIRGSIDAADGRAGVPCLVEMVDKLENGMGVVGTMRLRTGEGFSETFTWHPEVNFARPRSDDYDIVFRCEGYESLTRTVPVTQLWPRADLGKVVVARKAARIEPGTVAQRNDPSLIVQLRAIPQPYTYWIGKDLVGQAESALVSRLESEGATRVIVRSQYKLVRETACEIHTALREAGIVIGEFWEPSPVDPGWTDLMVNGRIDFSHCSSR